MADAPSKIHTIPMDFYGGKNPAPPEIAVTPAVPAAIITPKMPPKIVVPPKIGVGAPAAAAGSKGLVIALSIVGGIIVLGGGGFAYWYLTRPVPTPMIVVTPTPTPVEITEAPVIAETPTTTPETPVAPLVALSPIPAHNFIDSADSDVDGLTDVEEEMWVTSPAQNDSDADTFPDQTELLNLYNPVGVAPQKLLDTKAVNTYINPTDNYSVIYPTAWLARALDTEINKEVLFSGTTEEYIDMRTFAYPAEPFPDWFQKTFPNEVLASYLPFTNKMGVSGLRSPDNLVALFSDQTNVYLLVYNGGTRPDINFRTTFRMMMQSFKPAGVGMPLLVPLMPPTSATTTATVITTTTVPAVLTTTTTVAITPTTTPVAVPTSTLPSTSTP